MFHVQERSWIFFHFCNEQRGGADVEGEESLHVNTQFRRGGKTDCCLIERISQCLRPLCTTGSSLDAERQAWRHLVGNNDGSTGGFFPTGARAAVARAWLIYRWCQRQGKPVISKFSILALICIEPWQVPSTLRRTPLLPTFLCTACCLPSQSIRWTCPPHPLQSTPLDWAQVDLLQGPAESSARRLRATHFFEACFVKTVEPLPPKRTLFVLQASANFCDGPLGLTFLPSLINSTCFGDISQ